jgi:single-strand DNA-binding protein
MMSLTIGGRLGSDPTLGNANGTPVLNMSVACDGWDPKAREKVTTWVRVAFFGTRAEKLSEYLSKGSSVMCTGEARLTEYKGKQYLELTASAVTMMGSKPSGDTPAREQPSREQQKRAPRDTEEPPF